MNNSVILLYPLPRPKKWTKNSDSKNGTAGLSKMKNESASVPRQQDLR